MQAQKKQASVTALFDGISALEKKNRAALSGLSKLTARARFELLFDESSFTEIGAFNSRKIGNFSDSDRIIAGYGAVDGRLVFAFSQDYSNEKGAFGEAAAKKICSLYDLALMKGAPVIAFLDSNGAKLDEEIGIFASYGKIIRKAADASGEIPQIAVVMGNCSGALALYAANFDFIISNEKNGHMYMTAPAKIKSINENRKEFSGSADLASQGISALSSDSEDGCIFYVKKLLSYLPSNSDEGSASYDATDDINRATNCFASADSSIAFDAASVLADIADSSDVLELFCSYAPEIKCGFITLGGVACGFVANEPAINDGRLTKKACEKAAKFVGFCSLFGITVLSLVNTYGFDADSEAQENIISPASELALAYSLCDAPVLTLVIGRAYGSAFMAFGSKAVGADMAFALPYSEISLIAPETGVGFLWNDKFSEVKDAIVGRSELIEKWRDDETSPVDAASCGLIDDIIKPEETRQRLISAVYMLNN